MAAYSGTPTLIHAYELGNRAGQFVRVRRRLTLSLSSQGGGSNTISAVSLGFTTGNLLAARCILFVDGGAVKRWIALFTDGTYLYTADPTVATDANRGAAADVTGDLTCEVEGYN